MNGIEESPADATARLAALRRRIAAACVACGRDPAELGLVAVSKTFPATAVIALADAGQIAFGENYLQEALAKLQACARLRADLPLQWHFIGPIQSNKTRPIAEHFDWVQSVERERIAIRLSEQRPPTRAPLDVCIQVNVSGEASKSGCAPEETMALARRVATLPRLRLRGLMAIPEPGADGAAPAWQYATLRRLYADMRAAGLAVDTISVGMSADLEAAIAEGSTMLRIGTALFGERAGARSSRPGATAG